MDLVHNYFQKKSENTSQNVYGLVRIADEIVDTYMQKDSLNILNDLEKETLHAMSRKYSANPIVHAFALTANQFEFDKSLVKSFFESMRMDLSTKNSFESFV